MFDNNKVQDREVGANNTTPNRLASALSIAPPVSSETRCSCKDIRRKQSRPRSQIEGIEEVQRKEKSKQVPSSYESFTSVHKELDTSLSQDSLFHWEALFVAASLDLEDISLELISKLVTADFLSQSLVVELAAETKKKDIITQNLRKRATWTHSRENARKKNHRETLNLEKHDTKSRNPKPQET